MIPRKCKRLAEVDFPDRGRIEARSTREIHPARASLDAAPVLALLLPDLCDGQCPETFKLQARRILRDVRQSPASDADLRKALLNFIADFANWDLAADPTYLKVGRDLVRAAHGDDAPLVVDPFAGGGSIPLEALRLGCEAFASDLNPVACLILKVMLEDIPRHGRGLADELRQVGAEIKTAAEKELADLYPRDPDGATPIAYLWARTVRCEAPNCGAEILLMRSCWLCKKARRKWALRTRVARTDGDAPRVEFEIFEPLAEKEVRAGTVARAKATCVCCGAVMSPDRVRVQLAAQRGGADVVFDTQGRRTGGAFLLAVVTLKPGEKGRRYRLPTDQEYDPVRAAQARSADILDAWERSGRQGLCPMPDEPLPPVGTLGFRVQRYGMLQWGDLFTARQKVAMWCLRKGTERRINSLSRFIGLVIGKTADLGSSGSPWKPDAECPVHMLSSQKIPPFWDWAEAVPTADSSGSFRSAYERSASTVEIPLGFPYRAGQVQLGNATAQGVLPAESAAVWFTDPPYYDAIPYADLSDFFLVWLKRALPENRLLRDPFDPGNPLSPKMAEAVQDETKQTDGRSKDRKWFEETMARAFTEGRRVLSVDGVGSVVFAHKTTEGWEALLSGMIRGGWTTTGSWPIATEMGSRLRARDSAALATSVHLVCRPRSKDAPVGDWGNVLRELPTRVGDWMERLQSEGVRGADLVFACIGPALEIFSRYTRVETPDGRELGLTEYLERVWEVVGRTALENVLGAAEAKARNGLAGALEEDARLTALFLWTLQATTREADAERGEIPASTGNDEDVEETSSDKTAGFALVFDVVRRFAQPLGIDLQKWEKRTIETQKGVVRLLPVAERARQLFGERGSQAIAARLEREAAAGTDALRVAHRKRTADATHRQPRAAG